MDCPDCGERGSFVPIQKEYATTYRGRKFRKIIYGHRCLKCEVEFTDPVDSEELSKLLDAFTIRVNRETSHLTCATCLLVDSCPYRWDLYNTNGDCLASK